MKPNLFVLGAPKAGTTTLYSRLEELPDVTVSQVKELHYFSHDLLQAHTGGPGDAYALRAVVRSEEDYLSFFSATPPTRYRADVSPSYLYYADVADRIAEFSPGARAIALLRDPVERAYSQWLHLRRAQREPLDFVAALDAEPERIAAGWGDMWRYTESSSYTRGLERYAAALGRDHLLCLHSEHLRSDAQGVVDRLTGFLGLPSVEARPLDERNTGGEARSRLVARLIARRNPLKSAVRAVLPPSVRARVGLRLTEMNTAAREQMPEVARRRLEDEFADEATRLTDFLGEPPPWRWLAR